MPEPVSMDAVSTPPIASLPELTCFVSVADSGSFAEAGRRLGMTTSGVSKAIGRLEANHRVRLFNRSTHSLSLTEEGEQLLQHCRDLLQSHDRIGAMLSRVADGGAVGRVRIGAPPGLARKWLLPVLGRLVEQHPEIEIDVRCAYALVDLADEGIDLALRTGASHGLPGLFSQRLLTSGWRVYASPDYLARHGEPLSPNDLSRYRLLGFGAGGRARAWRFRSPAKEGWGDHFTIDVKTRIVFDDGCAAYEMAVAGHGLVWAPEWLAREDVEAERIAEVLADWRSEEEIVSVVRRERRLTPRRVSVVLTFLKQAADRWQAGEEVA